MEFIIGCNYWASHAGAEMWRIWDEETVRTDIEQLSTNGIQYLRVFPNWRDFQPIIPVYGGNGRLQEYRLEGDCEPQNPYWLDEVMLERFGVFCDICEEYHMKLIVSLLTGWMSGRIFIPAGLYQKELLTDATAILFEQRLIKGMVCYFREKKAIYAWDIGNECHCMGQVTDICAATSWTAIMANTIRAYDQSRQIISSCHEMELEENKSSWTIKGEAESCDILVCHPYPFWSRLGHNDYTASYRTMTHGTCQAKYYSDLSNKPCFIEEIGTMGPMICDNKTAADFIRVNLFSAWAQGASGVMWWCANEQTNLKTIPYTTNMCEIELGMLDEKGNPKPVLLEMKRIGDILKGFDIDLPKAKEDAVCILTQSQDQWGTAFMTYGLAQQAGLHLKFAYNTDALPESEIYLMPSVSGNNIMPREKYLALKRRVSEGAILYISNDNGILAEFEELCGMHVSDSGRFQEDLTIQMSDYEIAFRRSMRYKLQTTTAVVLAYDSLGLPAVTVNHFGRGKVYYVNFPLESKMSDENNAFDKNRYKLYEELFCEKIRSHDVVSDNPNIGVTLHYGEGTERYAIIINYSSQKQELNLQIQNDVKEIEVLYGEKEVLNPFEVCVFRWRK